MKKVSSKNPDILRPEEMDEADLLKDKLKKSHAKTEEAYNMSATLRKSIEIIELFKELDPFSKQVVIENLKDIFKKEKNLLSVDDYFDVKESAFYLDVTTRTIQNYLKEGKLRGIKKKRKWYIPREELNKLL